VGVGLNLHKACHVVIVAEPLSSLSTQIQAISRLDRLGQLFAVVVYNLIFDNTYDEKKIARNIVKHLPIILGETVESSRLQDVTKPEDFNFDVFNSDQRQRGNHIIKTLFGFQVDYLHPLYLSYRHFGLDRFGNVLPFDERVKLISEDSAAQDRFAKRTLGSTPSKSSKRVPCHRPIRAHHFAQY